jgi:hypothetical protein
VKRSYPSVPLEFAGKWIAWHRRVIVDSDERLGELMDRIEEAGLRGVSYEKVGMGRRRSTTKYEEQG